MRVTIKTIAERAGVHSSTVDKVIHNRGGVSREVEANIWAIIEELGYKPNPAGRALQRSGKKYRIAAILLDVDAQPYIAEGIRLEAADLNFDIDVLSYTSSFMDVQSQLELLEKAEEDKVDGIILSPIHSERIEEAVQRIIQKNIPVITVDNDLAGDRLCHVGHDAVKGACIAGRMMGLFLRGEGKAAVITNSLSTEVYHDQVYTRTTGFAGFMRDNYPDIDIVRYVEGFEDRETTHRETVRLLQEEADIKGIFIACGGVDAVGRAIMEAGKAEKISVVSFEEYPEILELVRTRVVDCTIGGNLAGQGRTSLRLIMDYLVYGTVPERDIVYMDARILVKESL